MPVSGSVVASRVSSACWRSLSVMSVISVAEPPKRKVAIERPVAAGPKTLEGSLAALVLGDALGDQRLDVSRLLGILPARDADAEQLLEAATRREHVVDGRVVPAIGFVEGDEPMIAVEDGGAVGKPVERRFDQAHARTLLVDVDGDPDMSPVTHQAAEPRPSPRRPETEREVAERRAGGERLGEALAVARSLDQVDQGPAQSFGDRQPGGPPESGRRRGEAPLRVRAPEKTRHRLCDGLRRQRPCRGVGHPLDLSAIAASASA